MRHRYFIFIYFKLFYNSLILLVIKMHKMLALLVRLVYNMCVSKKGRKGNVVNVTPKLYGVTAHRLEAACGLTLEGGYPTRYCNFI